ncbi:hypothetical protein MSG28_009338 [Choristoneura fumiferana]|uniref:Uncharacterized protein n=1 Tax=Choristoneura fumiferana TaxID=7141 RepID=A0ACC0KXI6_CHOFU|nr:hypothetical protein MSG28_009338 [Choristoneura fumiferana]
MSDEQLIKLVKRYSVLYDISSSQYRDNTIRNNAWEEIAEELHITVEECKERWRKLRNCFTNALKRRLKKSGQALTNIVPWKYYAQMKFLLPHVEGRRSITNLSTNVKDELTEDSQFSEEPESPRANAISSDSSSITVRACTVESGSQFVAWMFAIKE